MIYLEFHILLASCFIFIHYPSLPEAEAQEMLVPSEEPLASLKQCSVLAGSEGSGAGFEH